MVFKMAAKNHNGYMNGTIDKGHGFLREDVTLRYFMERLSCYTVYTTGNWCIYWKAFRWSFKISRKGWGDSTWVRVSRAEDWLLLQPNAQSAIRVSRLHTGLRSVVFLHTSTKRAWKINAKRPPLCGALRYTILHSLVLAVVLQFTPRMILSVQIKDCLSLLEVCNMFVCCFCSPIYDIHCF